MSVFIGEIVKYYRLQRNMSQETLANNLCSVKTLRSIEKGERNPSFELLNEISVRLNVDVFNLYGNVCKNNSLETHLICMQLNEAVSTRDEEKILLLIKEQSGKPDFSIGQPKQMMCYAESIMATRGKVDGDAIAYIYDGMIGKYPSFPNIDTKTTSLSNTEYALCLSYAVQMLRKKEYKKSFDMLEALREKAIVSLENDNLTVEYNKAFLLNIMCSCIYNEYAISKHIANPILQKIDYALNYQKKNNRSHMLPELLFCKAALLMEKEEEMAAKESFQTAKTLGEFFYGEDRTKQLALKIINYESDIDKFLN